LANGDEEQAIIKTIADAQNAFKASDLTATKNELTTAHTLMDEAEARHSSDRGLVEQMIQTAKEKHARFIDSDMLTKGSDAESEIENAINSAESTLLSDLTKSKEFTQKALDALEAVEQENAKERALQLLAQAKNDFATLKELYTLSEDDEAMIAITIDITEADTQASNKKYLQTIESAQSALDKINAYDEQNDGLLAASKLLTLPNGAVVSVDGAKTVTDDQGRETILPQYYTVTKREPLTDCFWRIAGYDFVYGNPLSWEALYEANIEILRERGNPDLIYPGQVLIIPSLRGERREGAYVEGKQYIPFSEAEVTTTPAERVVSPVYVN
ncbi:MAG: LysM peptidoglycan-binding domain-containing protein, partial [Treponemataceae bacterium]